MLALLAVFVYATHATQSVALRALRELRLAGNRALVTSCGKVSRMLVFRLLSKCVERKTLHII